MVWACLGVRYCLYIFLPCGCSNRKCFWLAFRAFFICKCMYSGFEFGGKSLGSVQTLGRLITSIYILSRLYEYGSFSRSANPFSTVRSASAVSTCPPPSRCQRPRSLRVWFPPARQGGGPVVKTTCRSTLPTSLLFRRRNGEAPYSLDTSLDTSFAGHLPLQRGMAREL